jgi:hypothetical protein
MTSSGLFRNPILNSSSGVIAWGQNFCEKQNVIMIQNGQIAYTIITNPYAGSHNKDHKKNMYMQKVYQGAVPSDISMVEQIIKTNVSS